MLFLAAESGGGLFRYVLKRVLKAKGVKWEDIEPNFPYDLRVPQIEDTDDLANCIQLIKASGAEVVFFDNLLRMLSTGSTDAAKGVGLCQSLPTQWKP